MCFFFRDFSLDSRDVGDEVDRLFLGRLPWERVPERGGQPPRAEVCSSESESGVERVRLIIHEVMRMETKTQTQREFPLGFNITASQRLMFYFLN